MEVRERIGTSVKTMVQMTDGDQDQDIVKVTTDVWERGGRRHE